MKISTATIHRPSGDVFFEVGQYLMINEEKSDIMLEEIKVKGTTVRIRMSDKTAIEYHNIPFSIGFKYGS